MQDIFNIYYEWTGIVHTLRTNFMALFLNIGYLYLTQVICFT